MDPEEQGAIDTTDDNSGAPPVMGGEQPNGAGAAPPVEDDSTGVNAAVDDQKGNHQFTGYGGANLNPADAPAGVKRIMAYLQGTDAVHPQTIDQVARAVDPEGKLPPADRNVMAIDHVRETHGDNAAWQLMQANRVAYNAKSAFGKVALQGTPQKPADINSAIDAANQAQSHVLDGSNVQFAPGPAGVTATVTTPGTKQPQQIQLSPQAFGAFLDVGGDGQWDKVMDHSAPATLQRLSQQYPAQQATQRPAAGGISRLDQMKPIQKDTSAEDAAGDEAAAPTPAAPKTNFGKTPSTVNLSGSDEVQEPQTEPETDISPEIEARANKLYPSISQQDGRNRYIAGEVTSEAANQSKLDVQNAKGDFGLKAATIKGQSAEAVGAGHDTAKVTSSQNYSQARIEQGKQKLAAAAAHEEAVNGRTAMSQQMRGLVSKVNAGVKLAPNEQAIWDKVMQGTVDPPQQAAPQQASISPAPQDPTQRKVGQVYSSPTGKRGKWMGNGWQAVQ